MRSLIFLTLVCVLGSVNTSAQQCGRQANFRRCPGRLCCSQFGFCGCTREYCGPGCQSQCRWCRRGDIISNLITRSMFDQMIYKHHNDSACPANGLYTYDAFIAAAQSYPDFATTGDDTIRKREIAAFLGQNSHEITDPVSTDPTASFKTAIQFWMTPQTPKPSCHNVITEQWTPSGADQSAGRVSGYGLITNIINGDLECGHGSDSRVQDRIGYYRRYCEIIGVSPGDNLDCANQMPFGSELLLEYSSV